MTEKIRGIRPFAKAGSYYLLVVLAMGALPLIVRLNDILRADHVRSEAGLKADSLKGAVGTQMDQLSLFGSVDAPVGVIRVTHQGCVGGEEEGAFCTADACSMSNFCITNRT